MAVMRKFILASKSKFEVPGGFEPPEVLPSSVRIITIMTRTIGGVMSRLGTAEPLGLCTSTPTDQLGKNPVATIIICKGTKNIPIT